MRSLELGVSGLSNVEYDIYTSSLRAVALMADAEIDGDDHGDVHYNSVRLNSRSVKDWFRSRYRHIPAFVIEQIMRILSPDLDTNDAFIGSQFFAALRLAIHVENGMSVKPTLIFEATKPSETTSLYHSNMIQKRPVPEATHLDGPAQKKVSLRQVTLNGRVTLTYDDPLRCVGCLKANIECRIDPDHIAVLSEWKDKPEWAPRPRFTACLQCSSSAKSCRLPGMENRPRIRMGKSLSGWKDDIEAKLERIEEQLKQSPAIKSDLDEVKELNVESEVDELNLDAEREGTDLGEEDENTEVEQQNFYEKQESYSDSEMESIFGADETYLDEEGEGSESDEEMEQSHSDEEE